jgi:glycosyltransferase involved in cell wall biosynthesis
MIDVLLPFHGDPDLMREAVNSVRRQSVPQWRLVILDDAYPDTSVGTWVATLGDERIIYVRNESTLGANANYRKALSLATADHLVVMGADDRMLPDYLQRMSKLIETHDGPAVIQPGVRVIDGDGREIRPVLDRVKSALRRRATSTCQSNGEEIVRSLMHGNWTYFPSLVWRRDAVQTVDLRPFHVVQDLALLVDVLLREERLIVDDCVTFEYRRHRTSDSALKTVTGERFQEESDYHRIIARELAAVGWSAAARAARLRATSRLHAMSLIPAALCRRHLRSSLSLVRHAFLT